MGGSRILDDDQIDEMAELREQGKTAREISEHFAAKGVKVTAASISWQCLRVGADIPIERRKTFKPAEKPYNRSGRPVRPFTENEDEQLRALDAEGLRHAEIGRRLQRKPNSIKGRLMVLARHEARAVGE